MAFTCETDEQLANKWALIPENTDILITHTPPYSILDMTDACKHVGSHSLRARVSEIKPKLHVFGHIHEQGGHEFEWNGTKYVNASHMEENYIPINQPVRVEL